MPNNIGAHHKHVRKRVYKNLEEYPHANRLKNSWDKIMYAMAIVVPTLGSAQVFKIWIDKDASGVSLIAWSTYFVNSIMWLVYGILHKEKPIILYNIIFSFINLFVVLGVLIF